MARKVYGDKLGDLAILRRAGAAPERHRALLACDVADVFGGMGSWDDHTPRPRQTRRIQAASAELFGALRAFFVATWGRGPEAPASRAPVPPPGRGRYGGLVAVEDATVEGLGDGVATAGEDLGLGEPGPGSR